MSGFDADYTDIADQQLDVLEAGPDPDLYNAVLDACELIFSYPEVAQKRSTAIQTREGIVMRLPVAGYPPWKVFWVTADTPTIRAIFRHPSRD